MVASLRVGDTMQIEKQGAAADPVVAKTADGKLAGSITAGQLLRLIQCIDEGFTYVAIVKTIDKGRVDVEVRPEAKK